MALADEIVESLESLEGIVADQVFTWNGNDYPCFASGTTKGGRMEAFGWEVNADLVIIVRGNLFATKPSDGDTIVHNGTTYRIGPATTAPGSAFLRLVCRDNSRGI